MASAPIREANANEVKEEEEDSPEYKALCECYARLVYCITQSPGDVVVQLKPTGMLAPGDKEFLDNLYTCKDKKSERICDVVLYQVKVDQQKYYTFVNVLKAAGSWTSGGVNLLNKALARLCSKQPSSLENSGVNNFSASLESLTDSCSQPAKSLYQVVDEKLTSNFDLKENAFEQETRVICEFFAEVVMKLIRSLSRSKVTVKELAELLRGIKAVNAATTTAGKPCLLFTLDFVKKIENSCEDVIDVFRLLDGYYSWFNFSLIEHIINVFDDDPKICVKFQEYKSRLEKYCIRRSELESPHSLDKFGKHSDDPERKVFKIDRQWGTISHTELETVIKIISDILGIERVVISLETVRNGCIELTFKIPEHVADIVFPLSADQVKAMEDHGIKYCGKPRPQSDSSPYGDQAISDLAARIKFLEAEFQSLASETLDRLQQAGICANTFYAKFSRMNPLLKLVASMKSFERLESLWDMLNQIWDFFNCELLLHVIRVMFTQVDDPLLSKLAEYEDKINKFFSSTKLCSFFKVWAFSIATDKSKKEKKISELKMMALRVNKKWKDLTLLDIKNISNTFAQCFFLPQKCLLVGGINKSSESLLFYIPLSLASSIEEKVQEKINFLSDNGFLSITINDRQIYALSPLRQYSLHLRKMYKLKCIVPKKHLRPFKLALITQRKLSKHDPFTKRTLRGDKDDIKFKKSPTGIDTLGYLPNRSPARLILLEGAPGSGKTTFSFDAAVKWANNEILTDISLLILFPLRDYNLRNVSNLRELFACIKPGYDSDLLLKELETCQGEGFAFWFDGWDEIASSLDGNSIYEELVSGKFPLAKVIVTSRSWATNDIKRILNKRPSQHIEIVSSVHDQIHSLSELNEKDLSPKIHSHLDNFLKYLKMTPAIQGNMHTPLATEITLEVYQWCQESSYTLPTTVTQLYTSYTCLCIHKYLDNHSHFESKLWKSNDFRDIPEPLRSWLFSLCQLAFDGLEDGQRLVFPDVPNHLRLETLGLMQAQAPLYANKESGVVSYHYEHLTLQEFLSALLLSWVSKEEREAVVKDCIRDAHGRFSMVLRFICGLTKLPPISRDHTLKMFDFELDKNKLMFFHWMFEGDCVADILDLKTKCTRVHSHYYWSALDYFVCGHFISHSNRSWDIDFTLSHMGDEKMTQFLQALGSAEQSNACITSIRWYGNELTSKSLSLLQVIPVHFILHLKSFNVSSNKLNHTAMDSIAMIIPCMPQLEELNLSFNEEIQEGDAISLLMALNNHRSLKRLSMSSTNIGQEDCKQLAQLLSSSWPCLEELNIGGLNSLSSQSIHILFRGLQRNSSLRKLTMYKSSLQADPISSEAMRETFSKYLQDKEKCKLETIDLSCCYFSPATITELAYGLRQNGSLKEIDLADNSIGDEGAIAIGQAIAENKSITKFELPRCDIGKAGGEALASSLKVNSTLLELDISGNTVGKAILAFAQLLEHNKTLKKLCISSDDSLDVDILLKNLTSNQTLEELRLSEKLKVDTCTDNRVKWSLP